MAIADGTISVDGDMIYHAKDLRLGLFKQPSGLADLNRPLIRSGC